jgi:hypothetical protein
MISPAFRPLPGNAPVDRRLWHTYLLSISLAGSLVLAGCGDQQLRMSGAAGLAGAVHGGQQPVAGATIQLYAAGGAGDGSASTPLLTTTELTNSSGEFNLGPYTCPSASTDIYLTATGGNPGLQPGQTNPNIAVMVALGPCGSVTSNTFVDVNELTTVAAAYALAPFMQSYTQVGSGAIDAQLMADAFTLASEMVNTGNGAVPGTGVPTGQTVPAQKIKTLANIVSTCVNSFGGVAGDGSPCGSLFSLATPTGGAAPNETVGALLNIAKNPTAEVVPLYVLSPPIAPFQPTLASAPADWTLTISSPTASPVFSPAPGTYAVSPAITLSDTSNGAQIYYTTDGSTPTTSSELYTGAIQLSATAIVRAIAVAAGISSVPIAGIYTIGPPTISLSPSNVSLTVSQTQSFTATVSGMANTSVSWSLKPSVGTLSSTGVYTAPASLSASQTVTVMATSVADTTKSASATVFLTPAINLTATPVSVSLTASQTQSFITTVSNTSNTGVTWSLSPALGTISTTGVYTAPAVISSAQTVTVTVSSLASPSKTATVSVSLIATPTYYVDNISGNDSNSGTSQTAPFASIAKVNSLALLPGQTVAFKSGDEWHEMLNITRSGTANAPITYTSYGAGAQPIISAADLTSTAWTLVFGNVWSHAQTNNPWMPNYNGQLMTAVASQAAVVAANEYYWDGSAKIYAYSTSDPSRLIEIPQRASAVIGGTASTNGANYIVLNNLELRGAQTYDLECQGGTTGAIACGYWSVTGNTFNASYANELFWLLAENINAPGLFVNNNVFKNGGSFGVTLGNGGVMNAVISYNQFYNLAQVYNPALDSNAQGDAVYGFSQGVGQYQSNVEVAYNNCHDIGVNVNNTFGGCYHPDTVTGWNIHNNVAQNAVMPGINIEKGTGTTAKYNLLINTGQHQYIAGLSIRGGEGYNVSNMDVENNTSYGGWWACSLGVSQNPGPNTASNIVFKKNICDGAVSGTEWYAGTGSNGSGNTFLDNNFGVAANNFVTFLNSQASTYAALDALLGYATANPQGDPQFVSPQTGNFMLKPTSPAVGIGAYP